MRCLVLLFWLLQIQTAVAYTNAEYNILGFSKDGRHFVFEEFIVVNANGYSEANLYVIDTELDAWVNGSYFFADHVVGDTSRIPEEHLHYSYRSAVVRKDVYNQASETLKKIGPLSTGTSVVRNLPEDFTTNNKFARFAALEFGDRTNFNEDHKAWNLKLETKSFPRKAYCSDDQENTKGFKLTLTNERTGEKHILSDDKEVPKSRNCPTNYWIEEVVRFQAESKVMAIAVIIRYAHRGFEGSDGRFMAVTSRVRY